ncbi:unnamed protein product [Chironomus riparius]|uniref:Odorant receptor n=1 Tax=Chironomus riparius TaxID=315576 RepID=A0A9N9WX02_9DIPT|nr:unnamed protein product [Chironomus riparius]
MDLFPFNFPMTFLKTAGIWQDRNVTLIYKLYGLVMHLFFLDQSIVLLTILLGHLVIDQDMIEFTEVFSKSLSIYLTTIKSFIFIINIEKIKSLMQKLSKLLKFSNYGNKERPLIIHYETKISKLTRYNYNFHFVICTLSVIMAILSSDRRLPFKTWAYVDYKNSDGAYMFMNCGVYLISLYTTGINSMLDFYPLIFMCYIIGMLEELGSYLKVVKFQEHVRNNHKYSNFSKKIEEFSIFDKILSNPKKYEESKINKGTVDLRTCISYHIKIKDFCNDVSGNYALHFMVQGFFSSLILCSTIFHLTKITFAEDSGLFLTTLMYAIIMILQILLPCHFGNIIFYKSHEISMNLFHSDWIYGDRTYTKNVKLIMEIMKTPMRIKVYGFFSVDYEIFKSVCNFAYSMYAVLNKKQN